MLNLKLAIEIRNTRAKYESGVKYSDIFKFVFYISFYQNFYGNVLVMNQIFVNDIFTNVFSFHCIYYLMRFMYTM